MGTLRNSACVVACAGSLGLGCSEPVLGDYPVDVPGADEGTAAATCMEGELERAIRPPRDGAVHIVEWMANPSGPDDDLEWVEMRFDEDADLNGVALGPTLESAVVVVGGDDCVPVDAGSWVVFGASPAAAPRVDAELPFSLANTGPRSIVAAFDGATLDRVDYEGSVEGVSAQLDDDGVRCEAASESAYASSNVGSPGDANPMCDRPLLEGECVDDGVARAINSPLVGEAFIGEWMPNPEAVENREGEWVEVRFERAVDLNGVTLADLTGESVFQSEACVGVAAGAHVVFAREANAALNGGIDVVTYPLSISLNNRDETIELSVGGQVLDAVSYARSEPGVAQQIDEEDRVCPAVSEYGDGDLGTPGAPNPPCT
jgi:hypothetical protein